MLSFGSNLELVLFPSPARKTVRVYTKVAPHSQWWAPLSNDRRGNASAQPNVRNSRTQLLRTTTRINRTKPSGRPNHSQSIHDVSHAFPTQPVTHQKPCLIIPQNQATPTAKAVPDPDNAIATTVVETAAEAVVEIAATTAVEIAGEIATIAEVANRAAAPTPRSAAAQHRPHSASGKKS